MWAGQPIRVEVTFEPKEANAVIQEFADRKVYHAPIIPQPARWLHMSRGYIATAITGVFSHFNLVSEPVPSNRVIITFPPVGHEADLIGRRDT